MTGYAHLETVAMSNEEMPDCEEWVSEDVSDEEPHVYESETPETRAQFRHLYLLVEASARHPLRARGSDASVRQANKIQTDMQNMQIAAQLVKLGQYKRGGSSKKGKAEMQGGSSKNTLHQEAGLLMTLCRPPRKAPLYPDEGYESWMED